MHRHIVLATAAVTLSAAAAFATQRETFRIHAEGVDPTVVSQVHADLVRAGQRIEGMFGSFPDTVGVRVYDSRRRFTAALNEAWGISETACWMVGAADDHRLYLLSPGAWAEEACEHDPEDARRARDLMTHELAHVYHGQVNPSADIGLLEDIGWFVEGFATYVSGQLAAEHSDRAAEAVASGRAPARLSDAWSGPYRYGVAGSLVAFIDREWGRPTLRALLSDTTQASILDRLGVTEAELLDRWEGWVASRSARSPGRVAADSPAGESG